MKVDCLEKDIGARRSELRGLCNARAVPFMLLFRRIALVASARSLIAGGLYSRHKKYSSDRLVDCKCKNDVCVVEEYLFGYVGDYMYEVTVEALKCKKCGKIHEIDDQDDVEIEYKINF